MKNMPIKSNAIAFLAAIFLFTNGIVATTHAEPLYAPDLQAGPEYDFRKTKWGMSAEEVKATENMVVGREGILYPDDPRYTFLIYPEVGFFEVLCSLSYIFDDNKLVSSKYSFYQPVNAYQKLIRICEQNYGPSKDIRVDNTDNTLYMIWRSPKTSMALVSLPYDLNNEIYEYAIDFYQIEVVNYDFAEPVSYEDYNPIFQAGPQYNFRKARWLMTMDEVLASEDAAPAEEGLIDESGFKGKYLAYPKISVFGHPAMPGYTFADEKLIIGSYFIKSEEDVAEDILEKCETQFGAHTYYTSANSNGEKQYTWDLGKTILTYNIAPYSSEQKERSYRLTFYYRKQLKEIPPN